MNPCTGNVISNLTTNLVYTQSNPSSLCRTSVMLYQAVEDTRHMWNAIYIYMMSLIWIARLYSLENQLTRFTLFVSQLFGRFENRNIGQQTDGTSFSLLFLFVKKNIVWWFMITTEYEVILWHLLMCIAKPPPPPHQHNNLVGGLVLPIRPQPSTSLHLKPLHWNPVCT